MCIISTEFSGSTVLDTLISSLPGFVGCGEITSAFNNITRQKYKWPCSCGAEAVDCPVWGPLAKRSEELATMPIAARYALLYSVLDEKYGPDYTLVDSSKNLHTLRALRQRTDVDLRVVFLVRDLRSYLNSQVSKPNVKLKIRNRRLGWLFAGLPVWLSETYYWTRRVAHIHLFLNFTGIEHIRIGYDELGLATREVEAILLSHLDAGNGCFDLSLSSGCNHMLRGNKLFIHGSRSGGFQYRDRRDERSLPVACRLVTLLMRPFNRRLAYPNRPDLA